MTEFTVVIPLYNKESFVERTLDSVMAQTVIPKEVIVVDDGSVDEGPQIVQSRYPHVRLLRQENRGVASARNTGIAAAESEWIAFLDADDVWAPPHLKVLGELVEDCPAAALVATNFKVWPHGSARPAIDDSGVAAYINYWRLAGKKKATVFTSASAARREALQSVGGFPPYNLGEELACWAALALRYPVAMHSQSTAFYVVGTGGLMDSASSPSGTVPDAIRPAPRSMEEQSPSFRVVVEALAQGHPDARDLARFLDDRSIGAIRPALRWCNVPQARVYAAGVLSARRRWLSPWCLATRLPESILRLLVLSALRMAKRAH